MPDSTQIKLIKFNSSHINKPDDPTFPYKLEVSLRPPGFMDLTFAFLLGGSEELVVRGMTLEVLEEFITENKFRTHPRLRRLVITGPGGELESITR